ncbi:TPA: hypothetical protein MH627_07950 [Klebsiella pneumoniae]|nr:hypothetical protein [Klebsiella pneumoniae]
MTDITELAQREKFEAWFKSSFHPDKTGPYIKDQLYFAWKAAGAELVEALEKAKAKADVYDMLRDGYGLREKGVGLADFVDWQANRIAELESRTVTVKPMRPGHITVGGEKLGIYMRDEVDEFLAALTAAGIKVEAE